MSAKTLSRKAADPLVEVERLLRPEQAAEHLQLSRSTIYDLMREGEDGTPPELRSVRIGRSRRIPLSALTEYVRGLTA